MYTEVKMKELLIAIAQGLVEDPTAVNVDVDDSAEDGSIVYHLHVRGGHGPGDRQAGTHRKGNPCGDACRGNPHQQQDFC